jgi:hypothetical protein
MEQEIIQQGERKASVNDLLQNSAKKMQQVSMLVSNQTEALANSTTSSINEMPDNIRTGH